MERLILSFVGNPSSGKSTYCQHLVDDYDFTLARTSDVIREYARDHRITLHGRPDFIKTHLQIVETLGELHVPKRILGMSEGNICLDGERVVPYVNYYRQLGAKIFAMWCPQELRYARSLERADSKDSIDRAVFASNEAAEYQNENPYGGGTMTIMQTADYHIDASRSLQEVTADLDTIVDGLLAE